MNRRYLPALMTLLALPAHGAEPEPPKYVLTPTIMLVEIGGHFGSSYEVIYDRRELRYYSARNGMSDLTSAKPVVVKPTDEQWSDFFEELDRLKVWDWKRRYENRKVADGTDWTTVIIYPTEQPRELVSSGSNAYPPNFDKFLQAVRKLIGGKTFK